MTDESVQGGSGDVWNAPEADATDALSVVLSGHYNQRFSLRASTDRTCFCSTLIRLIYFDDTVQSVAMRRIMARRNLCRIAHAVL